MRKNNGFTLIELLAVIVIIAIVAIIATPIILNVINTTRDRADLSSAYAIINASKLYNIEKQFADETVPVGMNILDELVIGGQKPISGDVRIGGNGDIAIALKYRDKCYKKQYNEETITPSAYDSETCKITESSLSILMQRSTDGSADFNGQVERDQIKKLTFANRINIPSGYDSWDVSEIQDGSVMAWYDPTQYELTIGANEMVYANSNSSALFEGLTSLEEIDLTYLNTSVVTDMNSMFANLFNLTNLDLSNFDTLKVTDMQSMFNSTRGLTDLNLSNFDTSSVTNMSGMFNEASNFESLDISNFDTSNVKTMNYMFFGASGLINLDLSNFDVSNVTTMYGMFNGCNRLKTLNLSSFDTSNVKNISFIFSGLTALTSLDLRSASFNSVTNSNGMFNSVKTATTIYVKDTAAKTWIQSKFPGANLIIP